MRQVSQEMQNLPAQLAREAQLDELKDLEKGINLEGVPPKTNRPPVIPRSPAVVLREAEAAKLPKAEPAKAEPDAESSRIASTPDPMDQQSANPEGKQ